MQFYWLKLSVNYPYHTYGSHNNKHSFQVTKAYWKHIYPPSHQTLMFSQNVLEHDDFKTLAATLVSPQCDRW